MTEVDFMANNKVLGYGMGPTLENQGILYAPFPTEAISNFCLPTEDVAKELVGEIIKKFDENTGFTKYIIELALVW